jgi:hypothetical protein
MVLGVLKVELYFPENGSLKEKRQYLRSIKDKVRASFNVSVAEVEHQDLWQRSKLAFACVSKEHTVVEETLSKVLKLLESKYSEFLLSFEKEFISL